MSNHARNYIRLFITQSLVTKKTEQRAIMTRGDNPRISLLRTSSKTHCSDLHKFQCALEQKFGIFHVAEFPFGFFWTYFLCSSSLLKAGICSCQSQELKASTDFGGSSICFTSSQKKKAGHQFRFPNMGSNAF